MSKLIIVADIIAKYDHIEQVKTALKNLIPDTLQETGCLQYDLHQNNNNPAHFLFYEKWESRELWQKHMNAAHIKAFQTSTEGVIVEARLYEMTSIDN